MNNKSDGEKIELLTVAGLAKRLTVKPSWVRSHVRQEVADPIPNLKFGRLIRFEWNGAEMNEWLARRKR